MAYASVSGRKPIERASKIAHAEIISNLDVQQFLAGCTIPEPAVAGMVEVLLTPVPAPAAQRLRAVIAIDGGYRETPVREEYPSAAITFFTFGPLFFYLDDLRALDRMPFIAPEDLARLKNLQRYTLVLPTRNVARVGLSLSQTIRATLNEFFQARPNQDPPLIEAFRWLLFRGWQRGSTATWTLPRCPNAGCDRRNLVLGPASPDQDICPDCGGPIYLIDALRLHEAIDEEQGAGGILGYVMTTLEQIVLAHLIKAMWGMRPQTLREILFIKDGPLAFFGQTAPLSRPMRELAAFLGQQPDSTGRNGATTSLLNVVGLEKSGAFVEHAMQIEDRIEPGTCLILSNDYIRRYIVPGDPNAPQPYGSNTYWGGKLIFKANDRSVYVVSAPVRGDGAPTVLSDFPNLPETLSVVGSLRCSMYDNALLPIALANKLVSLSEFPSARILENFARAAIR